MSASSKRSVKALSWLRRAVIGGLAAFVLFMLWILVTLPDVTEYAEKFPEESSFMKFRDAEYAGRGEKVKNQYHPVPMKRISGYLASAAIASEDSKFYEHDGVDVEGLQDALEENLEKGKYARGGSTITQQLAKNLYLTPKKSIIRKVREFAITNRLEKKLDKDRILELYLNVAEWGKGIYGCEAASRHWFSKSCADLSPREAALLAGALPAPLRFNPAKKDSRAHRRAQKIIRWLCMGKKIPAEECD